MSLSLYNKLFWNEIFAVILKITLLHVYAGSKRKKKQEPANKKARLMLDVEAEEDDEDDEESDLDDADIDQVGRCRFYIRVLWDNGILYLVSHLIQSAFQKICLTLDMYMQT